jgi:general L-amino acid transport system permease protein
MTARIASHTIAPRPRPPSRREGLLARQVASPINLAITAGFALFVWFALVPILRWAIVDATWTGTAETCAASHGACWAFIGEKLRFLVFGFYPRDEQARAGLATVLLVGLAIATALPRFWRRGLIGAWIVVPALVAWLLAGGFGLAPIPTEKWGGLPVTLVLTIGAFVVAFPLAIGLALLRRSRMRIFRWLAVGFVEAVRGVPLVTILYAATLLLPLMLPLGSSVDKFVRTGAALSLFVAAYLAEIVRAGLQAVPTGQIEAARSLGLGPWATLRLVVLPQALRVVVPGIVNLAIGIFQDTTLVVIIGMVELLAAARAAANDPQWLGWFDEAYAFAGLVYFSFCFAAARWSLRLERRLRPMG